jgi:hypothetical protein
MEVESLPAPAPEPVLEESESELELEEEEESEPAVPPGHLATAIARTFSASSLGQASLVQSRIPNL